MAIIYKKSKLIGYKSPDGLGVEIVFQASQRPESLEQIPAKAGYGRFHIGLAGLHTLRVSQLAQSVQH